MLRETPKLRTVLEELFEILSAHDPEIAACEPIDTRLRFTTLPNGGGVAVEIESSFCCTCPKGEVCGACRMSIGEMGHRRRLPSFSAYLASPLKGGRAGSRGKAGGTGTRASRKKTTSKKRK